MQTQNEINPVGLLIPIDPVHHIINQLVWNLPHAEILKLEKMFFQGAFERIKTLIGIATARAAVDPSVRDLLSTPGFLQSLKTEALQRQASEASHAEPEKLATSTVK